MEEGWELRVESSGLRIDGVQGSGVRMQRQGRVRQWAARNVEGRFSCASGSGETQQ